MTEADKDKTKYARRDYWDDRYQDEEEYDWLGDYHAIKRLISDFVPDRQDKILMLGCGNSSLSRQVIKRRERYFLLSPSKTFGNPSTLFFSNYHCQL